MRSALEVVASSASRLDVDRRTGVFVRMDGSKAVVNVGDASAPPVTIPCVGFTPPVPGMVVQLERRKGQLTVFGPAVTLNPIGEIKAPGTPKSTVTVDGVDYPLYQRDGYTPVAGDQVEINWATGVIQGKVTGLNTPDAPSTSAASSVAPLPGDAVLAVGSGQFRSRWQSNDVRASDTVMGAWFYGGRTISALAGANVTGIDIYLPLKSTPLGACFVGTHGYQSQPGGWTGIGSATPLGQRSGWVSLPASFAGALAGGGGIAVTSGNGDTQWYGTNTDRLSGALRFRGTR